VNKYNFKSKIPRQTLGKEEIKNAQKIITQDTLQVFHKNPLKQSKIMDYLKIRKILKTSLKLIVNPI
jgi:hypothetical protein